jgi:hypothetical protein
LVRFQRQFLEGHAKPGPHNPQMNTPLMMPTFEDTAKRKPTITAGIQTPNMADPGVLQQIHTGSIVASPTVHVCYTIIIVDIFTVSCIIGRLKFDVINYLH